MGLSETLLVTLVCWATSQVASYDPWDYAQRSPVAWRSLESGPSVGQNYPWSWVDASQPRVLSPLTPVSAKCGEAQVEVAVKRDLFGTGRLVQATDLTLGSPGCPPTSFDASQDTVIFDVGLHECGSTLQMTPDSLVYSISLYYNPTPAANALIVRSSPAEVPIECHYPRRNNVSSKAVQPTWVPFSSTLSAEQKMSFSLRLMNDDWTTERASSGFQLGDVMHIQADVDTENHVPLRLFLDSCMATLSPGVDSTPKYPIVDYKGCLVDGRSDSSSAFVSPRLKDNSLQFTVDVFRFTEDPRDLIYITCHLKVTAADQAPDLENKACSFNQASNTWVPVEGTRDICTCCESGNCDQFQGQPRRINPWERWGRGRRSARASAAKQGMLKEVETDVMLGPILILDAYLTSRTFAGRQSEATGSSAEYDMVHTPGMLVGFVLMAVATILALATVGMLCARKRRSGTS
ncbi:zona pellucida sperm-binding protein 3-like [Anolis carolinensis]|uniref:zona pellucida sperm-binding protein 3-like n=1 Tax=Anolis carolinensis TaxID=28377 RepID=UPI002F2B7488